VSGNEESENDGCLGSYESPRDPCPSVKSKQSSGPQDRIMYEKKRYTIIMN
jgi:hypothetical protein